MLNLMKMDLYRMFHSLSTWIIILFTVGIALFCVVMVQGDLDAMADDLRMHWKWSRKPRALLMGMRTDRSGFIQNLIRNGSREGSTQENSSARSYRAACLPCSSLFSPRSSPMRSRRTDMSKI